MSLYKECSAATRALMEKPLDDLGGVFTEIDIVQRVTKPEWDDEMVTMALRYASMIVGQYYRSRKLVRFGPVTLPDGSEDYGRVAAKIAYAPSDGISEWKTPNGTFPALEVADDEIAAAGRRVGAKRNDLAPWDDQEFTSLDPNERIGRLTTRIDRLTRRVEALEQRERAREEVYTQ